MTNSRPDGYKDFLQIFLLHRTFPTHDILQAIEDIGPNNVTAELRKRLLTSHAQTVNTVVISDSLKEFRLAKQNLSRYDTLAKGVLH